MNINKIIKTYLVFILFAINGISEVITPIPMTIDYDKDKALLGKKLFFDKRLSRDNSISCASCHILNSGGDGDVKYSFGVDNKIGVINSPTVFNTVFNFVQMRDGSAKNLKEQVHFPITNPIEMDTTYLDIILKLKDDIEYKKLFKKVYNQNINKNNINNSLEQFQTALITPNSKFDRYLRGYKNALDKDELDGFKLFKKNGCISCHNGVNIGGNLYQQVGIMKPYTHTIKEECHVLGRYNVTQNENDKYLVKVPTLRNIELTSPYLHNGSIKTLKDTVIFMHKFQVGIEHKDEDIDKIVKFLKTLTGELPSIIGENHE